MLTFDTAAVTAIANTDGPTGGSRFDVLGSARQSAAAKMLLAHAAEFNIDASDAGFDAEVYLASLVADLLALASVLPDTSPTEVVDKAIYYLSEADASTEIGTGLRQHWKVSA